MARKEKRSGKEVEAGKVAGAPATIDDMERWLESFFQQGWIRPWRMDWPEWAEPGAPFAGRLPKVDVIERDDEVVVRAEVPGVDKEDLDVSVSDNSVTIKGETKHEEKEEKGDYFRSEITRGSFMRTVPLPGSVDADKARTQFRDGVLELSIPRVAKAKRRKVKID